MSNKRAYSELSPFALPMPGQWPQYDIPTGFDAVNAKVAHDAQDTRSGRAFLTQLHTFLTAPARLVARIFGRQQQQVIVQPVIRKDGAHKKRIIAVQPDDEPATPAPAPRARPTKKRCGRKPRSRAVSCVFSPPLIEDTYSTSPMDWTHTKVFSAPTPAPSERTSDGSPVHHLDTPTPSVSSTVQDAEILQWSPNTHFNIIKNASITPARRAVLLKVAIENGAFAAQTEARQNTNADLPTVAEPEPLEPEPLNHVETVNEELSFLSDASDEDIPEDNGESLIALFSPSPKKKKSVRWETHAHTKSFFCDEKVADMMDSTLERINFSPVDRPFEAYPEDSSEDDSQDGSEPSTSSLKESPLKVSPLKVSPLKVSPLKEPPLREQGGAHEIISPVKSRGFRGVPDSTWDDSDESLDNYLDESQFSVELLDDLHDNILRSLALTDTPPPPEPAVKALVTPLSSEEQDKLQAAATATENGKQPATWLIPEKLNARDFSTLLPRLFSGDPKAWLNDNIVNEYLGLLMAEVKKEAGFEHKRGGPAPPLHSFSSFWYPTLTDRPKTIDRWAARFQLAKKQYLDADLILYPICDIGHWRLLAVKPKDRTIEYLDSLSCNGTKYINALKGYLAKELGNAWVEDEWTVMKKQRSIQQINGSDCGVFTILNALALMRGEEITKILPSDGMLDARERIAVSLLARAPTTEFD